MVRGMRIGVLRDGRSHQSLLQVQPERSLARNQVAGDLADRDVHHLVLGRERLGRGACTRVGGNDEARDAQVARFPRSWREILRASGSPLPEEGGPPIIISLPAGLAFFFIAVILTLSACICCRRRGTRTPGAAVRQESTYVQCEEEHEPSQFGGLTAILAFIAAISCSFVLAISSGSRAMRPAGPPGGERRGVGLGTYEGARCVG